MAKDKKGSKAAKAAPTPVVSKPLEAVKDGRVTKPIESAKSVAKDAGKKIAKEVNKASKKVKRDPTPESSSDEADDTSDSSASSDDESDQEGRDVAKSISSGKVPAPATGAVDSDSDSDSSSASDSEDEAAPKQANGSKINGAMKAGSDTDDSSSASDSEEEPKVNGKQAGATSDSEDDSDDDSSDSGSSDSDSDGGVDAKGGAEKTQSSKADSADSSDASSSDDEDDVAPQAKVEEPAKKRKAEDAIDQTPKKTKVMVDGEYKDPSANLFIGNLSWNIDEEWLTREFEEFGELSGVRIITDRDSGRSKGYGYVEFSEVDSAIQALEAKTGVELDGRNIRIDFSLPRQAKTQGFTPQQRSTERAQRYGDVPKAPSKTLFVGNVSFNADESMLTDLFQDYGTISAVRLPTDRETQQLKGYGYVDFTSIDEAKAAFGALQGASVEGRPIRLDYATERNNDSPRGGFGAGRGRGGFSDRGGRGGRGGFNDRGRGRGGARGGRGGSTNRGGFGDFSGKKTSF